MRILQVSNGYPPYSRAGVEQHTQTLSRALSASHQILVHAREWSFHDPNFTTHFRLDGPISLMTTVNNDVFPKDFVASYKNQKVDEIFERIIRDFCPDIIHFQHLIGLSSNLPSIASRFRIPFLFTFSDYWYICPCIRLRTSDGSFCSGSNPQCVVDYFREHGTTFNDIYSLPTFIKRLVPLWIRKTGKSFLLNRAKVQSKEIPEITARHLIDDRERHFKEILGQAAACVVPSEFLKQRYREFGISESKLFVIPYGIDTKQFHVEKKTDKKIRFVYLGTFHDFKGIETLVRAFRSVSKNKAILTIYGNREVNPRFSRRMERLARSAPIIFTGEYKNETLPRILSENDVVVVPSLFAETFNIVAHEAQAAGVPVIASRIGALPEVISHGENGLLFTPGEVSDLREQIETIMKAPHHIKDFSLRARKPVDIQEVSSRIESLYRNVLQNKSF